jgi:hypothetical protein
MDDDLKQHLSQMEARITEKITTAMTDVFTERLHDTETKLLRAFHGFQVGNNARLVKLEASDVTTDQRIAALEMRVLELETGLGGQQRRN